MTATRLYLDRSKMLCVLIRCEDSGDVHNYPAADAVSFPVKCKGCAELIDVRRDLRITIAARKDIQRELLAKFSNPGAAGKR